MTTPRPHADLAAQLERLESAIQAVCQYNGGYNSSDVQEAFYDVVNELQNLGIDTKPPPPPKRNITLTVNGREWVLPEPIQGDEPCNYWYISEANSIQSGRKDNDYYDNLRALIKQNGGSVYDTEADALAWSEFDKCCRGGGV